MAIILLLFFALPETERDLVFAEAVTFGFIVAMISLYFYLIVSSSRIFIDAENSLSP